MEIKQRIQAVLRQEAEAILAVEVTPAFVEAVHILRDCKGKVLATGIGKAGHIARKFSATLCSTATPSAYLHPGEAAHGDLGIVSKNDCIVAFSTSGKSNEVLEMLELSRHLGVGKVIGITSHPESPMRKLCDVVVDMGEVDEACPIGLTPSSSIAVMLAIGDALALSVMELNGVTKEQWGLRHHGGYLGRKARVDNV